MLPARAARSGARAAKSAARVAGSGALAVGFGTLNQGLAPAVSAMVEVAASARVARTGALAAGSPPPGHVAAPAVVGHATGGGWQRSSAATAASNGFRPAVLLRMRQSQVWLHVLPGRMGLRPMQLCGSCDAQTSKWASVGQQDSDDGSGGRHGVWHHGPTFVLEGSKGERIGDGDTCGRHFPC